jgi:hypothetical protein
MFHLCPKQPVPARYTTPPGTRCFVPPPEAAPSRRLAWTVTLRVRSENTQWPWYDTLQLLQGHTAWNSKIRLYRSCELESPSFNIGSGVAQSVRKMNGYRIPVRAQYFALLPDWLYLHTLLHDRRLLTRRVKAFEAWSWPTSTYCV